MLTAVLDACVLYPAPIRDLLMQLARQNAFQARWSDTIHDEWIRSVLADRKDLTRAQLQRTRSLMERHVPDGNVAGFEHLIPQLLLPDADDRHVLAAAIVSGADVIVTFNLADFPERVLAAHEVQAVHPDAFLVRIGEQQPDQLRAAVSTILGRLHNPPVTFDELVATLHRNRLTRTAQLLKSISQ